MTQPDDGSGERLSAEDVRAHLMHNRVPDDVLASALGVGLRSVYYYAAHGLPYLRIGGRRYFDISEARDWLIRRTERAKTATLPTPRSVGRPRKLSK
jgi:hypothetical protein